MVGDHPAVSHHHHLHKTWVGQEPLRSLVALLFTNGPSFVAVPRKRIHFQALFQHVHVRKDAALCPLPSPVFPLVLFVTVVVIYG